MTILGTLIIGFFAGLIAKLITPGHDPKGFLITIVLGVVGAFLATWLGQALGWYAPGETAGFFGAIVGSVIILVLWRMLRRTG
jgi:uncharacterized membrane protein YeaQ/YmgE (transglycosylase-associated protein family)